MPGKRLMMFLFALRGIKSALQREPNMKIHLVASVLAIAGGIVCHIDTLSWFAVLFSIVLVLAAELINSSLEAFTDLISPEFHKKAGMAKDMAAGAVLVTAIGALIAGIMVFTPHIYDFFRQ
ncbi:MAG: diacylglycerol kinase family protein [Bacteroidales bacterium]|nr:diacylglycerol kinase family protein [Bacteroidales bacterium]